MVDVAQFGTPSDGPSLFAEKMLDGFDALAKKTSASLEATQAIGSFFSNLSGLFSEFAEKTEGFFQRYKQKRVPQLDGSVKSAMEVLIFESEGLVKLQYAFADQLLQLRRDSEAFAREREKHRKKLVSDSEALQREWEAQLATMRKAKEAYHKAAKEAAQARTQAAQKEGDPKAKEKDVSSMQQKRATANEKASTAEEKYQEVLRETNVKQAKLYTVDQPALLRQFQEFEEAATWSQKSGINKYLSELKALGIGAKLDTLLDHAIASATAIDTKADVESFVAVSGTHVVVPDPIPFDPWSPTAPVSADPSPIPGGPSPLPKKSSNLQLRDNPSPKFSTTPAATAEPEQPSTHSPQQTGTPLVSSTGGTSADQATDAEVQGEGEEYQAMFDYQKLDDAELSMKTGDIVIVTLKDQSGWWFAVKGEESGYVPENFLRPVLKK